MEEAFWAARQGDALLHTSFMADVLGAVLEVAANVVIDALIVGTTSLLATSVGITMGCGATPGYGSRTAGGRVLQPR